MDADPTLVGLEGTVLVNELLRAYWKPTLGTHAAIDCNDVKPAHQEGLAAPFRDYLNPSDPNRVNPFRCVVFKTVVKKTPAAEGEVTVDSVHNHVKAGFALSDLYCSIFFRRIALHMSQRNFARSTSNDVGAAISAVLGLASAGGAVTGGIGAGFGLLDGEFRNYDNSFLVASDLPGLQNLVRRKQDEYRATVEKQMPDDYYGANTTILNYANLCSFTGMRALLNKSMTESADPTISRARMIEAVASFNAMATAITAREKEIIDADNVAHLGNASATGDADNMNGSRTSDSLTENSITPDATIVVPPAPQ